MTLEEVREWIKNNYRDDNVFDWILPEQFVLRIVPILSSELKVIQLPPPKERMYNCFMFAFGLQEDADFLIRRFGHLNPLGNGYAVQKLINNKILIHTEIPKAGDYIIYKNDRQHITHAGIVKSNDLIISKWGDGPTIEHPVLAVDPRYGNCISYYKKADSSKIKNFLCTK